MLKKNPKKPNYTFYKAPPKTLADYRVRIIFKWVNKYVRE